MDNVGTCSHNTLPAADAQDVYRPDIQIQDLCTRFDRFHMQYGAVHQSLAVVKIGALCSAECHFHLGYKRRLF